MSSPNYIVGRPRSPEQIAADQAFLEKARTLSPKFPDIAEALRRRQKRREEIAARVLLAAVPVGIVASIWTTFGWAVAGFGLAGFVTTCFVAGSRETEATGGARGRRPF